MEKIRRLSAAKIRKNKKESILLSILTTICMILLSSSVTSLVSIPKILPSMVEETGCLENVVYLDQKTYSDRFLKYLEDNERVERYAHISVADGSFIKMRIGDGQEMEKSVTFVATEDEMRYENFAPETIYSEEELSDIEHPVYLDSAIVKSLGIQIGDEVTYIQRDREFGFTVAGIYNSGLWPYGSKAVITGEDFDYLCRFLDRCEFIGINLIDGTDSKAFFDEYEAYCKDISVEDITYGFSVYTYEIIAETYTFNMSLLSYIVGIMAGVTIIAIVVMIRFRIVGDIREQIVSIGVLEALGYSSMEIAMSYVLEYTVIALVGVLIGIVPGVAFAKFLVTNAAYSANCGGIDHFAVTPVVFSFAGILIFVSLVALTKALSVRKFPPVLAFRKGIETHHFRKSLFPLEKTKGNVHIRLALKGFTENIKADIGLVVCIAVASLTVITSFILASFFGNTDRLLSTTCGHDLCDIRIEAEGLINPEDMKADLEAMPEVQKVLMSSDDKAMSFADSDTRILLDIYEDFALTNNIILTEGRLPEHDNEIAFTSQVKTVMGLNVGDTVTMEYGKIRRDFVITGIVNSVVNPQAGYMTESAFRTVEPSYVPDNYDIYLKDGADVNEFTSLLTERYGKEIADIANSEVTGDTYEERVRSAAEIKMAQEMIDHGVSYMEYTIQAGDTVISGSTSTMKIKSMTMIRSDYKDIIAQVSSSFYQISAALMAVAAIVVMIILSVLMESTIRKQYRDIGIMKGMGYTSHELMFQMAFRIVPSAVVAVFIGSFLSFMIVKILDMYIAKMSYSMIGVVITCIVILLFCFFCSFIGAKKIRKISVYELMTE